jgi:hypothetical protein
MSTAQTTGRVAVITGASYRASMLVGPSAWCCPHSPARC